MKTNLNQQNQTKSTNKKKIKTIYLTKPTKPDLLIKNYLLKLSNLFHKTKPYIARN